MPATVPDPPLLDARRDERGRVLSLCFTWRAVLKARGGRGFFVPTASINSGWRFFRQMVNAAEMLIKHEIAPAAWAAWTIDVWRQGGQKDDPPITLVWAAGMIEKKRGWFGRECATYMGGRVLFGEKHRELLRRWTSMGYALLREPDPSAAPAIVERWFPGATYDVLVRAATVEAATKTAELRERMESGEWLWS
jgi:hypothetical protein